MVRELAEAIAGGAFVILHYCRNIPDLSDSGVLGDSL